MTLSLLEILGEFQFCELKFNEDLQKNSGDVKTAHPSLTLFSARKMICFFLLLEAPASGRQPQSGRKGFAIPPFSVSPIYKVINPHILTIFVSPPLNRQAQRFINCPPIPQAPTGLFRPQGRSPKPDQTSRRFADDNTPLRTTSADDAIRPPSAPTQQTTHPPEEIHWRWPPKTSRASGKKFPLPPATGRTKEASHARKYPEKTAKTILAEYVTNFS